MDGLHCKNGNTAQTGLSDNRNLSVHDDDKIVQGGWASARSDPFAPRCFCPLAFGLSVLPHGVDVI